ncbi:EamA family transporter [Kineococcus terrestris]|uniref:EamA family transporter n=1 Tax=Kineococcus terrestris TaxID=2044856 RepID=UPI0034DB0748
MTTAVARPGPAVLLVLGSCLSLQVGAAAASHLFPTAGSTGATALRLGVAALVLVALARPRLRTWTRAQWRAVAALGACLAAMNGTFYAAIDRIPLGTAVTVEFLGPLTLAAVLSRRGRDLVWVGTALAGVVLLGTAGHPADVDLDPAGVALAAVAGVFWAGYVLTAGRVGRAVPGLGGLAVATAVAALLVLPLGAPGAARALGEPGLLPLVVATALLASVVPYAFELAALRRLPAAVFGVLLSLEPALAAAAGFALLGERLSAAGVLAIGLVVAASAGSTLSARRRAEGTPPRLPRPRRSARSLRSPAPPR